METKKIFREIYEADCMERSRKLREGIMELICESGLTISYIQSVLRDCTGDLIPGNYTEE